MCRNCLARARYVVLLAFLWLATCGSAFAQSTITFDNQSGAPALVKLVGLASKSIEVPTGAKTTVSAVPGRYHIKVRYGSQGRYRYTKGQEFEVTETSTSVSRITITLHKVPHGNYETHAISEEDFQHDHVTGKRRQASPPQDAESSLIEKIGRQAEAGAGRDRPGGLDPTLVAIRSRKTVRVIVEQSYSAGAAQPIRDYGYPFAEKLRQILKHAGVRTLDPSADTYGFTIRIRTTGRATGARYVSSQGSEKVFQWSGAEVSGTIIFESAGFPAYTATFQGKVRPAGTLGYPYNLTGGVFHKPSDAPFGQAYEAPGSFFPHMFDILGKVYGSEILLHAMLAWDDTSILTVIEDALVKSRKPPLTGLVNTLRSPRQSDKQRSARVLGRIKDPAAYAAIVSCFRMEKNASTRLTVARALRETCDPRTLELFLGILKDDSEDWMLRMEAVRALGDLGQTGAVQPLIAALQDQNIGVRREAASVLGMLRAVEAADLLKKLSKNDPDISVRNAASVALEKIQSRK